MWNIEEEQIKDYKKACLDSAKSEQAYKDFKKNPFLKQIWEHSSEEKGLYFIKSILNSSIPRDKKERILSACSLNDKIGGSELIKWDCWDVPISPSSLKYGYVLYDILKKKIKTDTIIEVGGGYGGQALTIQSFLPSVQYLIFDIPEAVALQNKYLKKNNVEGVEAIPYTEIPELSPYIDWTFISTFAIDELSEDCRNFYLPLISIAEKGYVIANRNVDWFVSKLENMGKNIKTEIFAPEISSATTIWWT